MRKEAILDLGRYQQCLPALQDGTGDNNLVIDGARGGRAAACRPRTSFMLVALEMQITGLGLADWTFNMICVDSIYVDIVIVGKEDTESSTKSAFWGTSPGMPSC